VLVRADLNVPIRDGVVTSRARIDASLPTFKQLLEQGAAVMVMSHLGRPKEGEFDAAQSLAPVAELLSEALGQTVRLERHWLSDGASDHQVAPGELVLLENVRFAVGEKTNDADLARRMADLCDVFVMDAFATAHRAHASTAGVIAQAKVACAGPLLAAEVKALDQALADPKRPLVAIVGGAKVSSKLEVLRALIDKVDQLIVGGGIANTFLAAAGYPIGGSLHEPDLVPLAAELIAQAKARGAEIPLPTDLLVAERFHQEAHATLRNVDRVRDHEMILDIGPESSGRLVSLIRQAGTVIWNGPVGVFEFEAFHSGTAAVAHAVAACQGFTLAGGGDTIAAIEKFHVAERIDYISTAGGAFLEYIEGKTLPALAALQD
jgi:phosphoglycerate kinase